MKLLPKTNPKCPHCANLAKKKGLKRNRQRTDQIYLCKFCHKSFISQHPTQKHKTYPLQTILQSISKYNLGTPLRKQQIPKSTIHDWVKNINLPMNRLRNNLKNTPLHEIIIKRRFIHHRRPFLFQYHKQKLEFAKKFPTLINYIKNIHTIPNHIFKDSRRISEVSRESPAMAGDLLRACEQLAGKSGVVPYGVAHRFSEGKPRPIVAGISKQNYAVELAKLAKAITKDNNKRHQIIEDFMLINDTTTIATEIPVYINENKQYLTGHIDILQIRFHKIYILDYKPEPLNKKQTITQLKLYRKALSKRTNIKEHKFKLAYFNDKGYFEVI